MKKIIFLAAGLLSLISASYATTAPLTVTFIDRSDQLAGRTVLIGGGYTVYGDVIDKITPSATLSLGLPGMAKITGFAQPGVEYFQTIGFCRNLTLKPSGTATIKLFLKAGLITCTCHGDACK